MLEDSQIKIAFRIRQWLKAKRRKEELERLEEERKRSSAMKKRQNAKPWAVNKNSGTSTKRYTLSQSRKADTASVNRDISEQMGTGPVRDFNPQTTPSEKSHIPTPDRRSSIAPV